MAGITDSPEHIWLEPKCAECNDTGRLWCEEDVWERCGDCGAVSVRYIRADLAKGESA